MSITIRDNARDSRLEAVDGDDVLGVIVYERTGEVIDLIHTVVEPSAKGRGVGSALARGAFDHARENGLSVIPTCPFISSWVERHPEVDELLTND